MDAAVREALDRCWGAFPASGTRAALLATTELYERLARRAAETLGLARPSTGAPRAEVARILGTVPGGTGRQRASGLSPGGAPA